MPQRLKLDCGGELGARHDATAPRVYCKRAESERTKPQARGEGASALRSTANLERSTEGQADDRASQPRHVPVRVVRGNWYRVLAYRPLKSRLSSDVTLHTGLWYTADRIVETHQSPRTSARHLQSIWPSVKTRP